MKVKHCRIGRTINCENLTDSNKKREKKGQILTCILKRREELERGVGGQRLVARLVVLSGQYFLYRSK